jgi:hypothetical protein
MSKEEPDLNLYETIVRIAKENISKAKDFVKPKRIFYSQNEDGYEDYDPDELTTPCECPPVGDKSANDPTDNQMQEYADIQTNLGEIATEISTAESALSSIQANFADSDKPFLDSVNAAIRDYNGHAAALQAYYNACTAYIAAINAENAHRQNMANNLRDMADLANQVLPIMNQLGIPISPPTGSVGSPTFKNAQRCVGKNVPGTPDADHTCFWLNGGRPVPINVFGQLSQLYAAWEAKWKAQNKAKQKLYKLQRTRRAAYARYAQAKLDAGGDNSSNILEFAENHINRQKAARANNRNVYELQYDAQLETLNSVIARHNSVSQGLPPAPAGNQEIDTLQDYDYTCENGDKLTCQKWMRTEGSPIPSRGNPIPVNNSSLPSSEGQLIQQSDEPTGNCGNIPRIDYNPQPTPKEPTPPKNPNQGGEGEEQPPPKWPPGPARS